MRDLYVMAGLVLRNRPCDIDTHRRHADHYLYKTSHNASILSVRFDVGQIHAKLLCQFGARMDKDTDRRSVNADNTSHHDRGCTPHPSEGPVLHANHYNDE